MERVRRQFCEEGLAMFAPKLRKTRSDKKIDGRVEVHLTALLCQSPPNEQPRWQLQLLAERLVELQVVEHISTIMVARLLKKNELKPFHGPQQWVIPAEQRAAFVCQMEQVLDHYEQPCDADYPVVCLDEPPKQLFDYEVFTTSSGQRCRDSEYGRRGVVELFVATEPLRGWRCLTVEADHQAATRVEFVARLMDTTYQKVHWVMDNLSTHKFSFFYAHFPPAMAQAYLRRRDITYTPTHGSWLNMAEIECSVLRRQVLDQPFTTPEQVRQLVNHWQDCQNARTKCMVPASPGVTLDSTFRANLWSKYFTAAPALRRPCARPSKPVPKVWPSSPSVTG